MKSMLIAATLVGAAIAALVLYTQKKNSSPARIENAANEAYDTINEAIGAIERPMHHSMG